MFSATVFALRLHGSKGIYLLGVCVCVPREANRTSIQILGSTYFGVGEFTTHFRTNFSGWIGLFTRGTIWILIYGSCDTAGGRVWGSTTAGTSLRQTWRRRSSGRTTALRAPRLDYRAAPGETCQRLFLGGIHVFFPAFASF